MTALLAAIAIFMIPFQIRGVPYATLRGIASEWPFLALFFALALNSAFYVGRTAFHLWRGRHVRAAGAPALPTVLALRMPPERAERVKATLRARLRRRGYRVRSTEDGFHAAVGERSLWGTLIFHTVFLLIVLAYLVELASPFREEVLLTEGQSFHGAPQEYLFPKGSPPESYPRVSFKLEKVIPRFWEDNFLFTDLYARVAYPAETLAREKRMWINTPLFHEGAIVALRGFGYAPECVVTDEAGREIFHSYVNLSIFPAGLWDAFPLGELPYECAVQVFPDHAVKGEDVFTLSHNLKNPLYKVQIQRNSPPPPREAFRGLVRPGETVRFDQYSLRFPDIRYYGHFRIQRTRGYILVFSGYAVALVGLAVRLVRHQRSVTARTEPASSRPGGGAVLLVGAHSTLFPKTFGARVARRVLKLARGARSA
jgi:hypothetical protein